MENRKVIQKVLEKLDFVNWDRYFGETEWTFFGWIDRKKDNYKDFVTITFSPQGIALSYATSSAEYTKKIAEILNFYHLPCNRIEYFHDLPNIIKEKCIKAEQGEQNG